MLSVRSQRQAVAAQSPGDESPAARAARLLAPYRELIEGFRANRRDIDAIADVTSEPEYGEMMALLRRAAVELAANPEAEDAFALLHRAAVVLDVPVVDLTALTRVPPHLVSSWRPRSVNVDLVEPDDASRMETTAFQDSLNKLSNKILPGVKEWRPMGLTPMYRLAGKMVPAVDALGKTVAVPLREAANVVEGWSKELADEVQVKLREIQRATSSSGLRVKDLKQLHPLEQKMALMTGQALSGLALEAELFIQWARDPKSVKRPQGIMAKMKQWASTGLHGLANFLRASASAVKVMTDADSWRTFAVHLQFGGGLEKWWVSSRAGATLMFPTLEQVEREGEAVVKVVSRLNPIDSVLGGVTLSSRGGGLNFRAGPVGAKVSDFEHEVKAGIPGIVGIAVGEDYAYGPVLAFGYSPPIGMLNVMPLPVNIRIGGEVKIFHAGFAAMSRPTRTMAERISIGCDSIHQVFVKSKDLDDGWPTQQRWSLLKRLVERAMDSKLVAQDRLAQLRELEPSRFIEYVGEERAKILGKDAEQPAKTHETIAGYLEYLVRKIDLESEALAKLARAAAKDEKIDKKKLGELSQSLKRSTLAFEYIDNLLYRLLVEPELERARETGQSQQRPPHRRERHEASELYREVG
jgi:hypothetical protein